MRKMYIYDCTLREGAQSEGISFSLSDKIKIMQKLDELGVSYIEGGNPFSNPKEMEFFKEAKAVRLINAKLCAFGSTRRVGIAPEEDDNLKALIESGAEVVTIFGKSWDLHVKDVLKTTNEENLNIIKSSILYLKQRGREVVFDAEHFFDGYKNNPEYALETLRAAKEAGADFIALCDTNGGSVGIFVYETVKKVCEYLACSVGIHCHNDTGLADANSILAAEAGADMMQVTIQGLGERCGNADIFSIIPNLQLKLGFDCIPKDNIEDLFDTARYMAEIINNRVSSSKPYIGDKAFAHKAGMHIDAISKNPVTFEHIPPEVVGNKRRFLMSEMGGRAAVLKAIQKIIPGMDKKSPETKKVLERLKELEYEGYQFEVAQASFELVIRKVLGFYTPCFHMEHFKLVVAEPAISAYSSSAMVKLGVGGKTEITADEGDGPVNALDKAVRKALEVFYPFLKNVRLIDFKVRVINPGFATASKVRVLMESTDGKDRWSTIGVSTDIIQASLQALSDSIEYILLKEEKNIKNEN